MCTRVWKTIPRVRARCWRMIRFGRWIILFIIYGGAKKKKRCTKPFGLTEKTVPILLFLLFFFFRLVYCIIYFCSVTFFPFLFSAIFLRHPTEQDNSIFARIEFIVSGVPATRLEEDTRTLECDSPAAFRRNVMIYIYIVMVYAFAAVLCGRSWGKTSRRHARRCRFRFYNVRTERSLAVEITHGLLPSRSDNNRRYREKYEMSTHTPTVDFVLSVFDSRDVPSPRPFSLASLTRTLSFLSWKTGHGRGIEKQIKHVYFEKKNRSTLCRSAHEKPERKTAIVRSLEVWWVFFFFFYAANVLSASFSTEKRGFFFRINNSSEEKNVFVFV